MRRADILKVIINTSATVGLGAMSLFGSVARAETYGQRLQAELNSGKDYSAAWAAAARPTGPLYAPDLAADANKAQGALNRGKDYAAAWEAASRRSELVFTPEHFAQAQKARDELNQGQDYAAAWKATSNGHPAPRVQAASKGGGVGQNERTRSTK